jgi:hypothetical protein
MRHAQGRIDRQRRDREPRKPRFARTFKMGMRFVVNLTDRYLRFFRQALRKSRDAVRHSDESEMIEAIDDIFQDIK